MKFQLIGKIMYDEAALNTASGDSNPVSKKILKEFDAVDSNTAIEQAKAVVKEVINRHCPECVCGSYETRHFTGLEVELRVIQSVWKTSVKSGNRSWEPSVRAADIQESHTLV